MTGPSRLTAGDIMMLSTVSRRLLVAGLAVAVSGTLALGAAAPAYAAGFPVPVPDPVNVLPSTVRGVISSGSIGGGHAFLAAVLRSYSLKGPERAAMAALEAGTATPSQAATVEAVKAKFKIPAFKMGGLVKGLGTAGVLLMAQQLVIQASHGVMNVLGVDYEGNVCSQGSPLLNFAASVDCTQWQMTEDAIAQANADINAGLVLPSLCYTVGGVEWCAVMLSTNVGVGSSHAQQVVCVKATKGGVPLTGGESLADVLPVYSVGGAPPVVLYRPLYRVTDDYWNSLGRAQCGPQTGGIVYGTTNMASGASPIELKGLAAIDYASGSPVIHGTVAEVTELEADPQRRWRCTVTLGGGGGVYTQESAPWRESDGAAPPVACPDYPPEYPLQNVTVWEVGGGETHEVYSQDATPEYEAATSAYPECGDGTCVLILRSVSPDVSCFDSPESCADWFTDPNKASKYSCHYGTHTVDLAECTVYAPTFKDGAAANGYAYGDPATGDPLPRSGPGADTGTGFETPTQNRQCLPTGWGVFNPIEWVMRPVQCAWEWATIPRPDHIDEVREGIKARFALSPPGKIAAAMSAALVGMEMPTGCEGVTVPLGWMKQGAFADADFPDNFHMLQACPGDPMQPWAVFSSLVIAVGMGVVAFKTLPALVGRIFTYGGIDG